jgi:hypothetical protein
MRNGGLHIEICWRFLFRGSQFVNVRSTGRVTGWACWPAIGLVVSWPFIVGCTWEKHEASLRPTIVQGISMLDESNIRAIARHVIAAHETWVDNAVYEVRRKGKGWSVIVWRIEGYDQSGKPQFVPGGHRVVQIDEKGRVTAYVAGR